MKINLALLALWLGGLAACLPEPGTTEIPDVNTLPAHPRLLIDAGVVYQETGDRRYADQAREILLAYTAKYLSPGLYACARGQWRDAHAREGARAGPLWGQRTTTPVAPSRPLRMLWIS